MLGRDSYDILVISHCILLTSGELEYSIKTIYTSHEKYSDLKNNIYIQQDEDIINN